MACVGKQPTYAVLNRWLHNVMAALFGEAIASTLSWHSFRIWLACALRSAKCPDGVIQLICRWKSPASLQHYAQIGTSMHTTWLRRAERTTFDAVRTANLPALDNAEHYAQLLGNGGTTPPRARAVAAAATTPRQPHAVPPPLLQSGERIEVLWGDRYFVGTFTSSRAQPQQGTRLHRVMYDAVDAWRAQAEWHDLSHETWRRV